MLNQKIIMMKGLPASGKTTAALQLLKDHPNTYKRINKDELRAMLDGGKWSQKNEDFILHTRDRSIRTAVLYGYSVIVDDTNLDPKHETALRAIVDEWNNRLELVDGKAKLIFEVQDFTAVRLEECVRRNQTRRNKVPNNVIISMYNRYLNPKKKDDVKFEDLKLDVLLQNNDLPNAIIFDLDGTLALFGENNPYDREFGYDELNYPVFDIMRQYQKNGYKIIICSGRDGKYLRKTNLWLGKQGINPDLFLMRKEGDKRKDTIVKREMFMINIYPNFCVDAVFDDRDQVVDMWRDLNLTCFQVANGNF